MSLRTVSPGMYKMQKCENEKVVMYRLRKSKNAEASAEVCVKCESAKVK